MPEETDQGNTADATAQSEKFEVLAEGWDIFDAPFADDEKLAEGLCHGSCWD